MVQRKFAKVSLSLFLFFFFSFLQAQTDTRTLTPEAPRQQQVQTQLNLKIGDRIEVDTEEGKKVYTIVDNGSSGTLGKGGFGVVYEVEEENRKRWALKVFKDATKADKAFEGLNTYNDARSMSLEPILHLLPYSPPSEAKITNGGATVLVTISPVVTPLAGIVAKLRAKGLNRLNELNANTPAATKAEILNGVRELLDFYKQIFLPGLLAGVDELGKLGLVHRDLKLGNMGLSGKTVVIYDPDLTVDKVRAKDLKFASGTPGFIAPECYRSGKVSATTDIHAAGVTILEFFGHPHDTGLPKKTVTLPSGEKRSEIDGDKLYELMNSKTEYDTQVAKKAVVFFKNINDILQKHGGAEFVADFNDARFLASAAHTFDEVERINQILLIDTESLAGKTQTKLESVQERLRKYAAENNLAIRDVRRPTRDGCGILSSRANILIRRPILNPAAQGAAQF